MIKNSSIVYFKNKIYNYISIISKGSSEKLINFSLYIVRLYGEFCVYSFEVRLKNINIFIQ